MALKKTASAEKLTKQVTELTNLQSKKSMLVTSAGSTRRQITQASWANTNGSGLDPRQQSVKQLKQQTELLIQQSLNQEAPIFAFVQQKQA